jgi:hypothetical protein
LNPLESGRIIQGNVTELSFKTYRDVTVLCLIKSCLEPTRLLYVLSGDNMTALHGEVPAISVGGPAYDAAYNSVEGKQWTEALVQMPPVPGDILAGATGSETSTKVPWQLTAELDEHLGELRPTVERTIIHAFEGVNASLTQRERHTRMMRLCQAAYAIAMVRRAEGVEISLTEQGSLRQLENLSGYYSQLR